MKRLFYFAAICAMLALTPAPSYSDILMNIFDDGTDLFMTATGTYDMTNAAPSNTFTGLGANAAVAPTFPIYGWETDLGGGSQGFAASYTGVLSGTGDVFPADITVTNNPFWFSDSSGGEIYFVSGAPLTGSVNELAIFNGITLASLGMVAGETVTVSWGNGGAGERATIRTSPIPEPATAGLIGLAAFGFCFFRRRE